MAFQKLVISLELQDANLKKNKYKERKIRLRKNVGEIKITVAEENKKND